MKQCLQAFLRVIFCSKTTSAMWCRGRRALRGPSVAFWKNSRSFELALPLQTCTGATIAWSCFCPPPDRPSGSLLLSFLRETAWSCLLTVKQDMEVVFCEWMAGSEVCGWTQHVRVGTSPGPSLCGQSQRAGCQPWV